MMTKEKKQEKELPDPTWLDWLVKSRTKNQEVSAKLYCLLKSNEHCWESDDLGYEAKTLTSVGFSLWRAAFLADKSGILEDTTADSMWFFGEMLETNSIAFVQDKKAKNFTFNYYLANVRFRLAEYEEDQKKKGNPPAGIDERLLKRLEKGTEQNAQKRWRDYQDAFSAVVDHFEMRLRAARGFKT